MDVGQVRELIKQFSKNTLRTTPYPTVCHVNDIVTELQNALPTSHNYTTSDLGKRVREYFRKQREYMNSRIDTSCHIVLQGMKLDQPDAEHVLACIEGNKEIMEGIRMRARLDLADENTARAFVLQRVRLYFRKQVEEYKRKAEKSGMINLPSVAAVVPEEEALNILAQIATYQPNHPGTSQK